MPSSYSPRYKLELPVTNDLVGTWGIQVNSSITGLLDDMVDAVSTIPMADVNVTLTIPNGVTSTARAGTLVVTGALTAVRTLTVPSGDRVLTVVNNTTGGFAINVKNPSSGSIQVSNGYAAHFYFIGSVITMPGYQFANLAVTNATITSGAVGLLDGAANSPPLTFASDTNTGLYRIGADSLGITTGGVLRMSVSNSEIVLVPSVTFNSDATVSKATPSIILDSVGTTNKAIFGRVDGVAKWGLYLGVAGAGGVFNLNRTDDAAVTTTALAISRTANEAAFGGAVQAGTTLCVRAAGTSTSDRGISMVNGSLDDDSDIDIRFQTGAATNRARIRGQKEGSANSGKMILSAFALAGVEKVVLTLASSGQATFSNDVSAVSFTPTCDARLKSNVMPINNALDRLMAMNGVTFDKVGANRRMAGVIAQDTRQIMSEAVVETNQDIGNDEHALGVDPMALVALLIEAVKELRSEVGSLRAELGSR